MRKNQKEQKQSPKQTILLHLTVEKQILFKFTNAFTPIFSLVTILTNDPLYDSYSLCFDKRFGCKLPIEST